MKLSTQYSTIILQIKSVKKFAKQNIFKMLIMYVSTQSGHGLGNCTVLVPVLEGEDE